MYRISATVLEKFRRVLAAAHDDSNIWDTERSLYESLTGQFEGNDKTRFGSAFHQLIEDGRPERIVKVGDAEYHIMHAHGFTAAQAEVAYQYKADHSLMICETAAGKFYHTPGASFYVSGRVDGIEGMVVRDAKTKFSAPTAQDYIDSCQWKFYLDILGVKEFYYDLFEVKGFDNKGTCGLLQLGDCSVTDLASIRVVQHEPISCFAYPDMRRDLYELVCAFSEWIRDRNYWNLLSPCKDDGSYATPPTKKDRHAHSRMQSAETS